MASTRQTCRFCTLWQLSATNLMSPHGRCRKDGRWYSVHTETCVPGGGPHLPHPPPQITNHQSQT